MKHGSENNNWKGGRSIASSGYVLIRVGTAHHLSDVRGYAYEHRLVAEQKIGRKLLPTEQVHHVNHNNQDNRPENLEVCASFAEHRRKHRSEELKQIEDFVTTSPVSFDQIHEVFGGCRTRLKNRLQNLRRRGTIEYRPAFDNWSSAV